MQYSQKYCLVSFLEPTAAATEFGAKDWPLHVTLADVFAIDLKATDIEAKLQELLAGQHPVKTFATEDAVLGTTAVVLLDKNKELAALHVRLIDLLEANGAQFNVPEFTREGFKPHCTIQTKERLHAGAELRINTITLIDMFPGNDWQRRKAVATFRCS